MHRVRAYTFDCCTIALRTVWRLLFEQHLRSSELKNHKADLLLTSSNVSTLVTLNMTGTLSESLATGREVEKYSVSRKNRFNSRSSCGPASTSAFQTHFYDSTCMYKRMNY